ncbi:MAG: hypothetical protein J0I41_24300 [Filimonas sp.]|nr:hypothetical protein [Filimonas sp.]
MVNYNLNGTPVNGVKIKTNLPFVNSSQMPTVMIEGYNYVTSRPINISLVWYIFDGEFINYAATTAGAYAPEIKLSNEGGKVVIFINDRSYFQRFSIRAFAQGMWEGPAWFTDWTTADEALSGTNTVSVPYYGPTTIQNGNVGIGTTSPKVKLDVNGAAMISNPTGQNYNENLRLPVANSGYAAIALGTDNSDAGTISGQWTLIRNPAWANTRFSIRHMSDDLFAIQTNGNVGIGTVNPTQKLAVNGTVLAKKVKVSQAASDWPDYVFDSSYQLPALDSVSSFIQVNKHLPDMPSAAAVEKDGHDVGEVQKQLLKKVEELTLYVIAMNKENATLKKNNESLQNEVKNAGEKNDAYDARIKKLEETLKSLIDKNGK